ncbi:MAG: 16S rRNA (uracil(1498)-N(3))-methyltransferase [Desulforhopalus sp.]
MRRFFFDPKNRSGDDVFLSGEESRHIGKALRLKVGGAIELFDGSGALFSAVLMSVGRRVEARITGVVAKAADQSKTVWVNQPILKGEKMDLVVQKCTELGITGMIPFQSSRCQGKLNQTQIRKKHERWQRISLAACKQCLRLKPMELYEPRPYSDLFNGGTTCKTDVRLLFWEDEKEVHLQDIQTIREAQEIHLMLGPEGGLTVQEVDAARAHGYQTVSLGDRILRAETATLSVVSIVQYIAGNLKG